MMWFHILDKQIGYCSGTLERPLPSVIDSENNTTLSNEMHGTSKSNTSLPNVTSKDSPQSARKDRSADIRRQQQKPKDWVELTMARAVLILFVFTLIYHLLTGL